MFQFVTAVHDTSEKMTMSYTDAKTHQKAISTDFSNVYYQFHQASLPPHNALSTPIINASSRHQKVSSS